MSKYLQTTAKDAYGVIAKIQALEKKAESLNLRIRLEENYFVVEVNDTKPQMKSIQLTSLAAVVGFMNGFEKGVDYDKKYGIPF